MRGSLLIYGTVDEIAAADRDSRTEFGKVTHIAANGIIVQAFPSQGNQPLYLVGLLQVLKKKNPALV